MLIAVVLALSPESDVAAQAPSPEPVDEQRLLEYLNTFTETAGDPGMLHDHRRCGTAALLQLFQARTSLSISTRRLLDRYLTRPSQPGENLKTGGYGHSYTTTPTFYNSPGGHFKIWYVTTGQDKPGAGRADNPDVDGSGVPDWVEQCAAFFDHTWRTAIDTMGYRPPPEDFSFPYGTLDNGGDGRYDVYIEDLGVGIAGYTGPEQVTPGRQIPSYMVVDNDYAGVKGTLNEAFDLLRATTAHEFFHAIQFGYDANEDIFWLEQSATWMEEQVFADVNDYITYVEVFNGFLTQPWKALDTQDGQHEFAGVLWPLFLSQRFGQPIIRKIWDLAETVQSLNAMEQVLQAENSSLKEAFQEFTVWNAFTGVQADPTLYYEEAGLYPLVTTSETVDTFPASGPLSPSNQWPAHLGANYISFIPDPFRSGGLQIEFTGLTGEWGVSVVGVSSTGQDTVITIPLSPLHQGSASVYNWGQYDVILLVPASLNRTGFGYQYQYTVIFDSTLVQQSVPPAVTLATFPNPFVTTVHANTIVRYDLPSPGRVVIKIYNTRGQEVRTLVDQQRSTGQFIVPWDGTDAKGRRVSSGVYLCRLAITDNAGTQQNISGKMMIIK